MMTDKESQEQDRTESRRQRFEQIKARELARGMSEDDAARIAADTVDKVGSIEEIHE